MNYANKFNKGGKNDGNTVTNFISLQELILLILVLVAIGIFIATVLEYLE